MKRLIIILSLFLPSLIWGQLGCDSVLVYYVSSPTNGVNLEELIERPAGFDFLNPSETFIVPNGSGGLPDITIPYTNTTTTSDWVYGSSADVLKMYGWIDTRGLGTIDLQDVNGNTGERIWPFIGQCCTNPVPLEELTTNTTGGAGNVGYNYLTTLEEGVHFIGWLATDLSANQGVQIQYAPTGTTTFANFPANRSFIDKPKVECKNVAKCSYELAEGESFTKFELCDQVFPALISSGGSSDFIEVDGDVTNELQEIIYNRETKELTISINNSEADLSLMPTWTTINAPDIVVTGSAIENLEQVLETDTEWYTQQDGDCREKYIFQYRVRVVHEAAGSWGIVRVPNIAGWDRRVYDVGTYRQNGNTNEDDGVRGALGDAPIMMQEAHEWSNIGFIYLNQVNDRDNDATVWVEFIVEYKRN